jgi:hypothetical protein
MESRVNGGKRLGRTWKSTGIASPTERHEKSDDLNELEPDIQYFENPF